MKQARSPAQRRNPASQARNPVQQRNRVKQARSPVQRRNRVKQARSPAQRRNRVKQARNPVQQRNPASQTKNPAQQRSPLNPIRQRRKSLTRRTARYSMQVPRTAGPFPSAAAMRRSWVMPEHRPYSIFRAPCGTARQARSIRWQRSGIVYFIKTPSSQRLLFRIP